MRKDHELFIQICDDESESSSCFDQAVSLDVDFALYQLISWRRTLFVYCLVRIPLIVHRSKSVNHDVGNIRMYSWRLRRNDFLTFIALHLVNHCRYTAYAPCWLWYGTQRWRTTCALAGIRFCRGVRIALVNVVRRSTSLTLMSNWGTTLRCS